MKSQTYINNILESNECSIDTAHKLTKALHREKRLHHDLMIRFRPLDGELEIVPVEWFNSLFNGTPCECKYHKVIVNISCINHYLKEAANEYHP